MPPYFNAVKITDSVYWVGAIDWNVRNFHGYKTGRGTTYNAYLILADKITLIDTVKKGFFEEMLARIASVVDPGKIEYIISNHAEPDHSGALLQTIKTVKPAEVFASKMGVKALNAHYGAGLELTAAADGEELDIGGKKITFMETRMLHWPDSMFSYLQEEQILFTQDAFGMHLASGERFADELPRELLERQAESYYANIITPFSPQVAKLLKKVEESGLTFNMVAPDHGPIWRSMEDFKRLLDLYKKWSNRELQPKVVILYDTMWQATEKMSRVIEDGIRSAGVKVEPVNMSVCDRSEAADKMLDAAALIVGSPTLNNHLLPSIADVLIYLKGLKFKTPYAAAFGSYGWSGEAVKQVKEYLEAMGSEILGEVKAQYTPGEEVLHACYELGRTAAEKVKAHFQCSMSNDSGEKLSKNVKSI
ncbi:MAG: FprA family A-type flavoprotein [Candidatus Aminicenantes bacterium]|nr:FprA family A-type flavoprotein [Candidatus Aminicenantes bacterium]